jgi:hypothetical protein
VILYYWLKDKPAADKPVTVEFLDGDRVLRTYSSAKRPEGSEAGDGERPIDPKAGLNRVVWDLRIARPTLLPRAIIWGNDDGPKVSPGEYRVRVKAGDQEVVKTVTVVPNPGVAATAEDMRAQFELLRDVRDRLSDTHRAVIQIRDVRAQMQEIVKHADAMGKAAALRDKAKAIDEKLTAIEKKLVNPNIKSSQDVLNFPPALDHQFAGLASVVASADAKPTDVSVAFFKQIDAQLQPILAELRAIYDGDLADFNRAVRDQGVPPVVVLRRE